MPCLFEKITGGDFSAAKCGLSAKFPFGSLGENERRVLIDRGKAASEAELPLLYASDYMRFRENGNRSVYEAVYFKRRNMLFEMAVGIAAGGDYAKRLADVLWAICEETTWVVPAHNQRRSGSDGKLTYEWAEPLYIDLFSAATGADVAVACSLAADALDGVTPLLRERAAYELKRRIFKPFMERDMYWMGFDGRPVNNWNPWIISNVLTAYLFAGGNTDELTAAMLRSMRGLDSFTRFYHEDGGCDEGCGYWGVAGASYFDAAELLYDMSGGGIDIFGEPLLRRMGEYIMDFYVGGNYCVNFADCSPKASPPPLVVSRFGRRTGSARLAALGASLYHKRGGGFKGTYGATLPYRSLCDIFEEAALLRDKKAIEENAAAPLTSVYYPGINVAIFRQLPKFSDGLLLAMKGGNNAESHNHNDVGTFSVYRDGKPLVIDVGVETYTAKTFSSERYSIWTMRSDYHNLPDFNGVVQLAGERYAASEAEYDENGSFSAELKNAYPPEAGIIRCRRRCSLDGASVRVKDEITLTSPKTVTFNFMLAGMPEIAGNGIIKLSGGILSYDGSLNAAVDELPFDDVKLRRDWDTDKLYRLRLTAPDTTGGTFEFVIS